MASPTSTTHSKEMMIKNNLEEGAYIATGIILFSSVIRKFSKSMAPAFVETKGSLLSLITVCVLSSVGIDYLKNNKYIPQSYKDF